MLSDKFKIALYTTSTLLLTYHWIYAKRQCFVHLEPDCLYKLSGILLGTRFVCLNFCFIDDAIKHFHNISAK